MLVFLMITFTLAYSKVETSDLQASRLIGESTKNPLSAHKNIRNSISGLFCISVGVFFFASPLIKLKHVIDTKNTSCLPFPIILASFFVTLQWWIYGYLIKDSFIQVSWQSSNFSWRKNCKGISSISGSQFPRLHFVGNSTRTVCYVSIEGWRQIQTTHDRRRFDILNDFWEISLNSFITTTKKRQKI